LAEWDTAYINDLPDTAFACIDAGGDKEDGKTVPRSLRHYPHHNAAGDVDRPHLTNALARVAQAGTATCGEAHLEAHAAALGIGERNQSADDSELRTLDLPNEQLQTLSISQRILGLRLLPYNEVADSKYGPLLFEPGAFGDVDPKTVRLRMDHADPPTGLGRKFEDKPDAPYMDFDVSRTSRGDDQLTLANDSVSRGVSVGYHGVSRTELRNGRHVQVYGPGSAVLEEVSTTWKPTFNKAGVMYVLSQDEKGEQAPMAETQNAPAEGAADEKVAAKKVAEEPRTLNVEPFFQRMDDGFSKFADRLEKLEERARSQFAIPGAEPQKRELHAGHWMDYSLRLLSGERIAQNDSQYLDLADIITTDNAGVVPDTFMQNELIGVIDPARPFMSSTRRLPTPASGMVLHVPVLGTRPVVGLQSEEKSQIATGPTSITLADFSAVTKAGGGDLSLQILKRSDPSFLDLYLRLLAEAYAIDSETEALEALLGADVDDGNTLDPSQPNLGGAWATTFDIIRRPPDTIWLSSAAVGAFIDAVAPVSGLPMYSNITASATAGGGITGSISGLRAVHVPVLGSLGADVIVGPSSGFAWAEDGTYTLQVDVPARAGRDVALVGILWFAPYYPTAFTVYTLAS
jgi:phage head maturation protease